MWWSCICEWWVRLRWGIVPDAEFVSGQTTPRSRGGWRLEMVYRFVSPGGNTIPGKDSVIFYSAPAPSTPVQPGRVVYVNDRLYQIL
jgi:hypothetical protein